MCEACGVLLIVLACLSAAGHMALFVTACWLLHRSRREHQRQRDES